MEFVFFEGPYEVNWKLPPKNPVVVFHKKLGIPKRSNFKPGLKISKERDQNIDFELLRPVMMKIIDCLNDQKNIEGILAFSEGGYLAYLFFSYLERGYFEGLITASRIPHCCILISPMGIPPGVHLVRAKSLHFYSSNDNVIPLSESSLLRYRKPKGFFV